ncbi:MAG: PIN domain-containing protein [Alphaproteobacteria bacterium]
MNARAFIDTNILIYALARGDSRWETARKIVRDGGVISVQVLNEFVSVSRRKLRLSWLDIAAEIEVIGLSMTDIVPLTIDIHDAARSVAERHKIAFYDALLVAAAIKAKCKTLYTEDLHDGAVIEGVAIRNPFIV